MFFGRACHLFFKKSGCLVCAGPAFKRKSSDPNPGEDGPGPAKLKVGVFQRLGALGGAGGGPSFVRASEQSMGANTG